ncbi:reverse transcriptase family protein [Microbacterium sp. LBN7]|uniref:reverse transcriptase family protein n=1 Tax=Microbacterium sp. LBN7 TaxID=3129773 RepID=UPI00324E5C21
MNLTYLESVVSRRRDPYHIYSVRKRDSSSRRRIAAPHDEIRTVQRWILDNVLADIPVHPAAFAYVKNRSAPECARQHLGASWIVKLDIQNFFHHYDEVQVYGALAPYGYSPLVRLEIARIATRHPLGVQRWLPAKYWKSTRQRDENEDVSSTGEDLLSSLFDSPSFTEQETWLPYDQGERLGYLPQGSPASGAIANLLSRGLDESLSTVAASYSLTYTRYADDITLSASGPFNRRTAESALYDALRAVARAGLFPNRRKCKIVKPGTPLEILGVRIDGDVAHLSKRVRNRLEFHLRGVEKFGIAGHAAHTGFADGLGLSHHIHGLIRYAHDVDPTAAAAYFESFERLFPVDL